jgi:hypothetical protein
VTPVVVVVDKAPSPAPIAPAPHVDVSEVHAVGPYGDDVRSVQLLQTVSLVKEPRKDAAKLGVIKKGTRAAVQDAAPAGDGCSKRWIQLEPRGWVCETALAPSHELPTPAKAPSLAASPAEADDEADPPIAGVYGYVYGDGVVAYANAADAAAGTNGRALTGATSVRAAGVVEAGGRRFWLTSSGDLIDAASIGTISPSKFRGVTVENGVMPAWVWSSKPVDTRSAAGTVVGHRTPREVVFPLEVTGGKVRIADDEWIARDQLRIATIAAPPEGSTLTERWFDVDLDEQVLVAYEGAAPVYATLVSTGKWGHDTPTEMSRVESKYQTATMNSDKVDVYSVADVPWTMYYDHNFALHTSYWHDGFGGKRSHGCINLSPHDARVLYKWSSPDVPPGWIAVYADADNPGSLVRTHSRHTPEPQLRGYARTIVAAN